MYNNELKNIDSSEKAYLLGLFYSDGCIHSSDGSYYASITLHEDDKYLLDVILSFHSLDCLNALIMLGL